ncbi:MAG: hypothetical protein RLZZ458_1513, partial [Planctomycetota bacterium]
PRCNFRYSLPPFFACPRIQAPTEQPFMITEAPELHDRIRAWIGTALMISASIFAVLIFCDRTGFSVFELPRIWHNSRSVHLLFCGMLFLCAAVLLKSPPEDRLVERQGRPLFQSCRLLTRAGCHLCDDALETLLRFQHALPSIEVVDIDGDPLLMRQFGESIPIVEIDGRVRFRGRVNWRLLQRIIDAAELRNRIQEGHFPTAASSLPTPPALQRSVDG